MELAEKIKQAVLHKPGLYPTNIELAQLINDFCSVTPQGKPAVLGIAMLIGATDMMDTLAWEERMEGLRKFLIENWDFLCNDTGQ